MSSLLIIGFFLLASIGWAANLTDYYYLQPSYMFTDKEHRGPFEFSDELGSLSIGERTDDIVSPQTVEANDKDLLLNISDKEDGKVPGTNGSSYSAPLYDTSVPSPAAPQSQLELLTFNQTSTQSSSSSAIDDLFGLGIPTVQEPAHSLAPPQPLLKLNPKAVLDPATFQQKWRQLPVALSQVSLSI